MRPLLIMHSNHQTPIDVAGQEFCVPSWLVYACVCYILFLVYSLLTDCFVSPVRPTITKAGI